MRLKAMVIRGGWKPKINPTPKLEERIAASVRRRLVPLKCPLPEREARAPPHRRAFGIIHASSILKFFEGS